MQPYHVIKFKCLMLRLIVGIAIIMAGVSIGIAIIREMIYDFDILSRIAYAAGLAIIILMCVVGVVLIYQGLHFDKTVFKGKDRKYEQFKKELEAKDVISAGDLILTEHFILTFAINFFRMCTLIKTENIIACFENPIYGTVSKPSDYTLYFYDKDFKCYTIVLGANKAEDGHDVLEILCGRKPWIISENRDEFMDNILTKAGRRRVLTQIEKRRYRVNSTVDTDKEAKHVLDHLESDVKEKLNFKSILHKRK